MKQDEIIEMARHIATTLGSRMCDENGDTHGEELYCMAFDDIVDSIKLVAAKEREACAEMCDSSIEDTYIEGYTGAKHSGRMECAAAIRKRGEA